ncbi:MAG: glycerate kinase, partial [Actinomycetes bacterium]
RLRSVRLRLAVDVQNPLCGPAGAAHAFAGQKGADAGTRAELDAAIASYIPVLRRDERVDDAVRWLRSPQLGRAVGPAYRILFAGAVASLPDRYRRMLGLRRPWWPAITATRLMLAGMRVVLGTESSSMRFTQLRLARLAGQNA